MNIKNIQLIRCVVLAIVILPSVGACGWYQCGYTNDSEETLYCVNVINSTDSPIKVKYDWGEDTIDTNTNKTVTWWSSYGGEYIEVDYRDKSKIFDVRSEDTVQVYTQDFQ
jgi:hypothetical protein